MPVVLPVREFVGCLSIQKHCKPCCHSHKWFEIYNEDESHMGGYHCMFAVVRVKVKVWVRVWVKVWVDYMYCNIHIGRKPFCCCTGIFAFVCIGEMTKDYKLFLHYMDTLILHCNLAVFRKVHYMGRSHKLIGYKPLPPRNRCKALVGKVDLYRLFGRTNTSVLSRYNLDGCKPAVHCMHR